MFLVATMPGCEPDVVEADSFARSDAGVIQDAGTPVIAMPDGSAPGDQDASATEAGGMKDGGPPGEAPGTCNLSGPWLVAQRLLVTAAGQEQSAQTWFYYDLQQQGTALTVMRGLHCGYRVVKKSPLAANVDSSAAWPAFLARNSSAGRRGQVTTESGGCHVTLAREYVVRGATVPHYLNPAVALPDRTQAAGAGNPGWEDWDADGNPGISIRISSALASGTLFDCQREWTEYDGLVPAGASKFKARVTANNEHVVLGRAAGAPQSLETSSSLSSDSSQHYAWLHRLEPSQAAGTDAEICAAVRSLTDSLVPESAQ
jgi:hypothetical protein